MLDRREFLRLGAALGAGVAIASSPLIRGLSPASAGVARVPALLDPDANGLQLPPGFTSRIVARGNQPVGSTGYTFPIFPDGAAVYAAPATATLPAGYVYAVNSETIPLSGLPGPGVSSLRFAGDGTLVGAYRICEGTLLNCAGGRTRWGTWLTCEEYPQGRVWECDPLGRRPAVVRPALGTFQHEAVACDGRSRRLYLTEDISDGRFYRFTPTVWGDLSAGVLEVAVVTGSQVTWLPVPNPNPTRGTTPTRYQVPASTPFNRGEGMAVRSAAGLVYFATTGDNKVWELNTVTDTIRVVYDAALDPTATLTGIDNLTMSPSRDIVAAEDGGNLELVMVSPAGVTAPIVRVTGQTGTELTGPAFDPSGTRLYFSSQRAEQYGITYEVTGPFPTLDV